MPPTAPDTKKKESAPSEAVPHVVPIWNASLAGFLPEDKGPHTLTPNTVELIPTLGALPPGGGPVQDPVLTRLRARW